jgi:rubrerythrin
MTIFLIFCSVPAVFSAPAVVNVNTTRVISVPRPFKNVTDINILQSELALEHLEAAFYVAALQKFFQADFIRLGFTPRDYQIITEVRDHELAHVAGLQAAITSLGGVPVEACIYNFPDPDVRSFLAIARTLEKLAVSAFIGGAKDISNPTLKTLTTSIATNESRHAAFFNYVTGKTPAPQPFDIPLGSRQILSLVAPNFISSCPYLLTEGFPTLAISPAVGSAGISVVLKTVASITGANCAFVTGTGVNYLVPVVNGACVVPRTLFGDVFVILTSAGNFEDLSDSNTLAGPASFTVPDKADIF